MILTNVESSFESRRRAGESHFPKIHFKHRPCAYAVRGAPPPSCPLVLLSPDLAYLEKHCKAKVGQYRTKKNIPNISSNRTMSSSGNSVQRDQKISKNVSCLLAWRKKILGQIFGPDTPVFFLLVHGGVQRGMSWWASRFIFLLAIPPVGYWGGDRGSWGELPTDLSGRIRNQLENF